MGDCTPGGRSGRCHLLCPQQGQDRGLWGSGCPAVLTRATGTSLQGLCHPGVPLLSVNFSGLDGQAATAWQTGTDATPGVAASGKGHRSGVRRVSTAPLG